MADCTSNEDVKVCLIPTEVVSTEIDLRQFFKAVINCQKVELKRENVKDILCGDLNIESEKLSNSLLNIITEAFKYYMLRWPGWQDNTKYYAGKLSFTEWYEDFRNYLCSKSNFIIYNASHFSKEAETATTSAAIQTDGPDIKSVAPYTLCINGPPSFLNNIIFMESQGNIQIRHNSSKSINNLKINELLNWPHVSVEVNLPDISLTRTNTHQVESFVGLSGDSKSISEVNYISFIKKEANVPDSKVKRFTHNYISTYVDEYIKVLPKVPGINDKRIAELQAIFSEFLLDIVEVDLYDCTMCTYSSVEYHIGKNKYIRSRKLGKKKKTTAINFCEILIPHVEFTLHYFNAVQDHLDRNNVTFQSLNGVYHKIKNKKSAELDKLKCLINETSVKYSCTLCSEYFLGSDAYSQLSKHFVEKHGAEHPVRCTKCGDQFDVQLLTSKRWQHLCERKSKSMVDNTKNVS